MSGVDIAGLVSGLRQALYTRKAERSALPDRAADALLEQAAELAERAKEVLAARGQADDNYQRYITATRQRDEALAALKASEEARDAATKLADRYGVALMMIRAGCSNPQRFAGNILDDVKPIDIDLEDLT